MRMTQEAAQHLEESLWSAPSFPPGPPQKPETRWQAFRRRLRWGIGDARMWLAGIVAGCRVVEYDEYDLDA